MSRLRRGPTVLFNTTFHIYTVEAGRRKGELGLADDTARHIRTAKPLPNESRRFHYHHLIRRA